jgi:DNA-binding beta-propeller fold protein YncE
MHFDTQQLAAYLDGGLSDTERADLRAHVLTCATCAARLDRLRDDGRRIAVALSSSPTPDVRGAVRARLARGSPGRTWLARGLALAGALAGLLLFAVLAGARAGATAGRVPDRLVVLDKSNAQLVALDADTGARQATLRLAESPIGIKYDQIRDRLYVLLARSVIVVDQRTLHEVGRWDAPQAFSGAGLALDAPAGRLYVAQPGGVAALAIDQPEIALAQSYDLGSNPSALSLSPNGATLYALNAQQARLWTINTADGGARSQALAAGNSRSGYLGVSSDGRSVYVLLTGAGPRGDRPALWRIDRAGQAEAPALLAQAPTPWDLELLDTGQIAIPRGDGRAGGVELIAADTLSTTARLEPAYDQHHVVVGPSGTLYGLNYTHATITRFDGSTGAVVWRTAEDRSLVPWDGVYVRGGWRWPF